MAVLFISILFFCTQAKVFLTMEADGLVERTIYAEVPPRVEYTLTQLGKSLEPILKSMWNWGIQYKEGMKSL